MNKRLLTQHFKSTFSRHARLLFATSLVLSASAFVISAFTLVNSNLNDILTLWGENIQMSVYLNADASTDDVLSIQKNLSQTEHIGKFEFINQEKALDEFKKQLSSYAPDLSNDQDLLKIIPASFQVSINSEVTASEQIPIMNKVAGLIKSWPGVEDVSFGQEWVKNFASLTDGLKNLGKSLSVFVLICAMFVISNSVQSAIHARRAEIEVFELIGASAKDIRTPYILESTVMGFLCATAGVAISYGLFSFTKGKLLSSPALLQIGQNLSFLSVTTVCLYILAGGLSGAFAAYMCLRKLNQGWAASQR